jgi:PAS domain S-box-containing protein
MIVLVGGVPGAFISVLLARSNKQTQKLKDSEKKYQTLIDLSLDGIYIENERGEILDCNTRGHEMFGYTKEEMLQLSIRDLVPPGFREFVPEIIPDEMATGEAYVERENMKKDGSIFPTEINTRFVTLNGEKRLIAYVKDNTSQKAIEKALRESEARLRELNATKDKLLSIIAHDLKNQFNAILGYSEMIRDDADLFDKQTLIEYAADVNSAARSTFNLLENLLHWAMMQKKVAAFKPVQLNLNELVMLVLETIRETARIKGTRLMNHVSADQLIYADRDMLRIVLRNLISNAIKFTPRDGQVEVFARNKEDGQVTIIEIKDNGQGMTPEKMAGLFNFGESQSSLEKEKEAGTGLGLVVCKDFIEKHQGKIWVESEPGKGAAFFMQMPVQ